MPGDREDDDRADAAHDGNEETPVADRPRVVLLLVCSEACRAKLVVAVEEEKESR